MPAVIKGVVGRKEERVLPNGRVIRNVGVFDGVDYWTISVSDGLYDSIIERKEYEFVVRPRIIQGKLIIEAESVKEVHHKKEV